jgi:hypothetical protein
MKALDDCWTTCPSLSSNRGVLGGEAHASRSNSLFKDRMKQIKGGNDSGRKRMRRWRPVEQLTWCLIPLDFPSSYTERVSDARREQRWIHQIWPLHPDLWSHSARPARPRIDRVLPRCESRRHLWLRRAESAPAEKGLAGGWLEGGPICLARGAGHTMDCDCGLILEVLKCNKKLAVWRRWPVQRAARPLQQERPPIVQPDDIRDCAGEVYLAPWFSSLPSETPPSCHVIAPPARRDCTNSAVRGRGRRRSWAAAATAGFEAEEPRMRGGVAEGLTQRTVF